MDHLGAYKYKDDKSLMSQNRRRTRSTRKQGKKSGGKGI